MAETSVSLLDRLRERPDGPAWQRLVAVYEPLIRDWLRRYAVQDADAADLTQEVFCVLVRELPQFHYDRARGSFRGWLRTVTVNRLRAFWRDRQYRPQDGTSDVARMLDKLADPASGLSRQWDEEHDRYVAARLLEPIEPEFEPATWRAFRRVAIEGARPAAVAAELGVTTNSVFIAKSRVLRRLRQEMQGLTG